MRTIQLGKILRSAREAKGLSLQDSANLLGSTKGHIHALETGAANNPTLRLLSAFVIVYGIRPEVLISSAVPEPNGEQAPRYHEIARWLSAALEDPAVCQEMKDDILAWFEDGGDQI